MLIRAKSAKFVKDVKKLYIKDFVNISLIENIFYIFKTILHFWPFKKM